MSPYLTHHTYVEGVTLDEVIKDYIDKALYFHKGDSRKTALALGMSKSTLYRKINRKQKNENDKSLSHP